MASADIQGGSVLLSQIVTMAGYQALQMGPSIGDRCVAEIQGPAHLGIDDLFKIPLADFLDQSFEHHVADI